MTDLRALTQVPPHVTQLAGQIRELAGDDDLAFIDTLDGVTDAVGAAGAAIRMILANEAHSAAAKALSQRYAARARDFEERASKARDAVAHFMGEIAAKTLQLPEATITLSAGSPSVVGDADPNFLPEELVRVTRTADRAAIKLALLNGDEVPGYGMSNARPRLTIRAGRKDAVE